LYNTRDLLKAAYPTLGLRAARRQSQRSQLHESGSRYNSSLSGTVALIDRRAWLHWLGVGFRSDRYGEFVERGRET
jgi:hypothetical protein